MASTPALAGRAEVGKFYMVPCIKVALDARTIWMDVNGWVPVLGPKHTDAEHLEFQFEHWHIDWRFVGHKPYRALLDGKVAPHGTVLTNDGWNRLERNLTRAPELRRIKCKREMPDFPEVRKVVVPDIWTANQSGVKCRPHRGLQAGSVGLMTNPNNTPGVPGTQTTEEKS